MTFSDYGPHIKIEDPEVKDLAQHIVDSMKLSIIKGLSHNIDPQAYPILSASSSVESAAAKYFKEKPQAQRVKIKNITRQMLAEETPIFKGIGSRLEAIDLHSNMPILEQVDQLNLSSTVLLSPGHLHKLEISESALRLSKNAAVLNSISTPKLDLGDRPYPFFPRRAARALLEDPIVRKYEALGGESSFLGKPVNAQGICSDGKGKYQHYEHGSIYWSPETGAHEIHGSIRQKWKALGWQASFLGYPVTDERTTSDKIGRYTHFQKGSIYWTPETGAHEIHGAIRDKWSDLEWERGYLGYPVTDEKTTPDTIGRYTHFQGGSIYWTPRTGAHAVHKEIQQAWSNEDWELGFLGYPLSDTRVSDDSMFCKFQGGQITWEKFVGTKISRPNTKLLFRIHKVKCIDETDPELWLSDTIDMGGVATDINGASATKIKPYRVKDDFDDGEQVVYNPPRTFHTFNLDKTPGWPKNFLVTTALAEIDSGGFNDFLKEVVKKVRDAVVKLVTQKTASLTGAALGAAIGAIGGPIGSILGVIAGWIVGELFNWIIGLFEDDPFPVYPHTISLPSIWHSWSGYTSSPGDSFWTQAHGGKYQVWSDWSLVA